MDSQLATVLTSGSLDVQNGSQHAEGSGRVTEVFLDPKEKTSPSTVPGNLQPCPVTAALTIRRDAPSINGKKPEVGGTSKPAFQETRSKIAGLRQPITVKAGVPVVRSQPIRLKIVVPPQCKRPITNSVISLTKDFTQRHFRRPAPVSAEEEKNRISAVKNGGDIQEVSYQKTEDNKPESFHEAEKEEKNCKEKENIHEGSETLLIPCTNTENILTQKRIKEENTEQEIQNIPLILQEMDLKACKKFDELRMEEQSEPLDLSLPKKRESRERRCGRFLDDFGCESSLIMEVDEYEGEGDRDVVEEDDEGQGGNTVLHMDGTDTLEDSLLSPSYFSNSVLDSLSSVDCDTENLLLIDDQGIPYTLSPDGLKVPQVDASRLEDPQLDQASSAEVEDKKLSQLTDCVISQSLDNAPSDDLFPSPTPDTESVVQSVDQTTAKKEVLTSFITNSDPPGSAEPSLKPVQESSSVLSVSSGISLPSQPIQILTNPSTNTPILLLSGSSSSPQLSSAPVGLSLPLSVSQTSPGASTPMFLLLSSVPTASSGDSASTSTPIAILDPTTGQLSQISAASTPAVSVPLPSGQLGSPLPTLSHPVIRLSPNNPPVILSGVNNINPGPVVTSLTMQSSSPAPQNDLQGTTPILHSQTSSSESNPGSEAISAEDVSNENNKPSTSESSTSTTFDPLAQLSSEAQSPASEPKFDSSDLHSQHLPLDDHLYFSNAAAPSSPPVGSILSSGKLEPLDPLDPVSSEESSNNMGSRRVLYCQLCPRVFFYLSDLERHAITHSQKKPHVCSQCGKAFKRSSHLQRHKHIHTGQRNFVCPICTKRFREAGELQRHQRVHTGEKPYQCQLCHTRFAERNTLRRHTKRKHPYHQVAMEMLNERRAGGRVEGGGGEGSIVQEEEESAEWYSSTVSHMENSESEVET
ncbi:zinc finger protein 236 [Cheilinus undulatus]|uniref:zinc finger protein 236 n=1 Tax=Cheilinus undulatus TaxID=241271 RepID=UPI001BD440E4|nr:zinc finger protein 236 [Cheilinus undulatus]